jgi:hypothetical protein
MPNSNVSQGTRIVIITVPNQLLVCCADVGQMLPAGARTIQHAIFDNANTSTYSLKIDKRKNDIRFGFAVADTLDVLSGEGGTVTGDLNGDGVQETFRDCTSREGVHLTIWSGEPLKGSKLWHAYFYLGYDTEPSCVDRDFQ